MSAQTALQSLLSMLRSLSSSYMMLAGNTATSADDDLLAMRIPPAATAEVNYAVNREIAPTVRIPRPVTPPDLPSLILPVLPEMQDLQADVAQLDSAVRAESPILSPFHPIYEPLPDPLAVDLAVPYPKDSQFQPGEAPVVTASAAPEIALPKTITAAPLSGSPPASAAPSINPFVTADFKSAFEQGAALVPSDSSEWTIWLTGLRADWAPAEGALVERLRGVMSGTMPGLPDTWEQQRFEQGRQSAFYERLIAVEALDMLPASGTGLPSGQAAYGRLRAEVAALQAVGQAAVDAASSRQETETKHLQLALSLVKGMADTVIAMRSQEGAWRMQALELALDGAEATLAHAEAVLAMKEKEQDLVDQYNALLKRQLESQLSVERSVLESLKIDQDTNKLRATYNSQQSEIEAIATAFVESRIALFEAQLSVLENDKEERAIAYRVFEAEVTAYRLESKRKQAQHAALKAKIKKDKNQIEAEMQKLSIFDVELAQVTTAAKTEALKLKRTTAKNKQSLSAFNAASAAYMQYVQSVNETVKVALGVLEKRYAIEEAEQKIGLSDQRLKDKLALGNAINALRHDMLTQSTALKQHRIALNREIAQSQIITQGASVYGGIATQALSSLSAVGATEIVERS